MPEYITPHPDVIKAVERAKARMPYVESIVTNIMANQRPEETKTLPGREFARTDVGAGPEEGYWPIPARNIGQYKLSIDKERIQNALDKTDGLKDVHVSKNASLFLELETRAYDKTTKEHGDYTKNSIGTLVLLIPVEKKSVVFQVRFFLNDGSVGDNISAIGVKQEKKFLRKTKEEALNSDVVDEFLKNIANLYQESEN